MKTTPNYNLKKPETSDFYDVGDFNDNADAIDEALHDLDDKKMNKPVRAALTIPTAGWIETGGYGEFTHKNVVRLDGVTVNDILSGQVTMETEVYAQNAHLSFQNQTANGTVTFYAERIPEGNIEVVYSLLRGMG